MHSGQDGRADDYDTARALTRPYRENRGSTLHFKGRVEWSPSRRKGTVSVQGNERTETVIGTQEQPARRVLVVDDSRLQRRILCALLRRWGYEVDDAESAQVALELCETNPPDIVVSDWMMPEMDGPEFCQAFRAMERDNYGYFILLTSKSEKGEIAAGLDAGADDFLTKPVNGDELRARLSAGERILQMQARLVESNNLLQETLDKLDHDLIEARKLQQSLVRERHRSFGGAEVSLMLRPSGHVGGDLVGFFPINSQRVALYSIDVSGHGVASALMTARLAGYLSGASFEQNIALFENDLGIYDAHPPETVATELNRLTLTELETENYFTLVFVDLNLCTGHARLVQAGHPHPILLRADGQVEYLGNGGMPVGLIPDIPFEGVSFKMKPGDRLFITSDGVTECEDPAGKMLDQEGLSAILQRNAKLEGQPLLETLVWDLADYAKSEDFDDDVSAVVLDFLGFKDPMAADP